MTTTTASPSTTPTSRRALAIVAALIVAAAVIALIVAVASPDETGSESVSAGEAARIPTGSVRQVSFAETDGTPLPRFDNAEAVDPAVGMSAPDITASYFDNAEVTLKLDDGTPRILLFVAHWCPHCQAEVPTLSAWFTANGVPSDVEVVAISTSVDEGSPNYPPSSWLLREGWPIPVLRDSAQGDLASGFGLSSFPFAVVVDGDGEVVSRTSGALTEARWEAALAAAVG